MRAGSSQLPAQRLLTFRGLQSCSSLCLPLPSQLCLCARAASCRRKQPKLRQAAAAASSAYESEPAVAEPRGFGSATDLLPDTGSEDVVPAMADLGARDVRASWNAVALAFLGDAVWELYVRRHFFAPPKRLTAYYGAVVEQVCAERQEVYYELLLAGSFLTAAERDILRWGNNARVTPPRRFGPTGKAVATYKHATALECLVGYLYTTDPPRLHALMAYLGLSGGPADLGVVPVADSKAGGSVNGSD